MKKTTLLLSFALALTVSGLAQPTSHWPEDQKMSPTQFIPLSIINSLLAQGAFGEGITTPWTVLGQAEKLRYNITWNDTSPNLGGDYSGDSCIGINYSISVTSAGTGCAKISFTWTGPNNTGGTTSYYAFKNNLGRLFDSQGNLVDPNTLQVVANRSDYLNPNGTYRVPDGPLLDNLISSLPGGRVTLGNMQVVTPHWDSNITLNSNDFVPNPDQEGNPINFNVSWVGETPTLVSKNTSDTSGSYGGFTYTVTVRADGPGKGIIELNWKGPGNTSGGIKYYIYKDKPGRLFDEKGRELDPKTLTPKNTDSNNPSGAGNVTIAVDVWANEDWFSDYYDAWLNDFGGFDVELICYDPYPNAGTSFGDLDVVGYYGSDGNYVDLQNSTDWADQLLADIWNALDHAFGEG